MRIAAAHRISSSVRALPDGAYSLQYATKVSGSYVLCVTLDGTHVAGSPFPLVVRPAEPRALRAASPSQQPLCSVAYGPVYV